MAEFNPSVTYHGHFLTSQFHNLYQPSDTQDSDELSSIPGGDYVTSDDDVNQLCYASGTNTPVRPKKKTRRGGVRFMKRKAAKRAYLARQQELELAQHDRLNEV